jgi:Beta-lactamase class C and other penicillin binding proteins
MIERVDIMRKGNDLLLGFRVAVMEQNLGLYGIVIRQHGEIIAQHRWRSDDDVQLYSVSKTFTAMAAGVAIGEGFFKLSDQVVDFFPELIPERPDEKLLKMTVKHLLTMATGHSFCPFMKAFNAGLEPANWAKVFLDAPLSYEPGTRFEYNNGATYMVSAIIQRKTGMKTRDYLIPRVFTPLHIFNPQWEFCPQGVTKGFMGLFLTTEKLSRFGQLLLNRGEWDGKRLIPAEYVEEATQKQIDNSDFNPDWYITEDIHQGYGYQIWLNSYPNSYRLDGLYGQYAICFPEKDAVVTITAHQEGNQLDILKLAWDTLADRL